MQMRRVTVEYYAPGAFSDRNNWRKIDLEFDVRSVETPARTVAEARFQYRRLAFTDGELPPDRLIDDLMRTIRHLPPGAWVHLHCDTGAFRSTMVFALLDMMKNYNRLTAAQIIHRQAALGGTDFAQSPDAADFLHNFHDYCHSAGPNFRQPWSPWKKRSALPQ